MTDELRRRGLCADDAREAADGAVKAIELALASLHALQRGTAPAYAFHNVRILLRSVERLIARFDELPPGEIAAPEAVQRLEELAAEMTARSGMRGCGNRPCWCGRCAGAAKV